MPGFPTERALVLAFVADHLEELRDYFLPGDDYRTSSEEFRDHVARFIEEQYIRPLERCLSVPGPEARRELRRAQDALQQLADQQYSARLWNGERTIGHLPPDTVNLRDEDRPTWNAWHNRLQHAQMRRRSALQHEVLEARDPLDGHVVSFGATDMEPPLEEGSGNQLSATVAHLLRRSAEQSASAVTYSERMGYLKCRSLTDVHRFETHWTWEHSDPTADEVCMDIAKPRVRTCLAAVLALPQRYRNRTVRWTMLDLLLDRISPCFAPSYAAGLVEAVFRADPTYKTHIKRLAMGKAHRGRPLLDASPATEPRPVAVPTAAVTGPAQHPLPAALPRE
jgi:hypothetical protein